MLRTSPSAGLALALLPCLCHALTPAEVFESVRRAVPVLETLASDGQVLGFSSAISLGGGRFVAMCSPLDGSDSIRLGTEGLSAAATVVARDTERNLCLLTAPDAANLPALPQAPSGVAPPVGSRVFAVSNALGFGTGLSEGVVSGIRAHGGGVLLQFSAPISPGSEGGALVDGQGRLLGVIDYRHRDGQNVNFAAPAAWIAEIEQRQERDAKRQALRDRAPRLAREGDGAGLARLAADWTTRYSEDSAGWLWLAVAGRMTGDAKAEEEAWRRARALEPASGAAGLGLAESLVRQGRFADAREVAQGLLQLSRENAAVWAVLGQALHGIEGASATAEEAYRKALSLDPWQPVAHQGLILMARQRGDHAAAIAGWTHLVRLYPDSPQFRWNLVESLLFGGQAARAYGVLARLPEEIAGSGDALYWKGATSLLLSRPQEAIDLFRESLKRSPSDPARVWSELGNAYFFLQRFPEAIAAHREALRLDPGSHDRRYWLAVTLKDGGHVAEALEIDLQLVKELPNEAQAWRQLGYARATAGVLPGTIEAVERSLALDPAQPKAWRAIAVFYRAAGRGDDVLRAHATLRGLDAALAEQTYRATIQPYEVSR